MNNNYNVDNGFSTAVQAENERTLQQYVATVMRKVYGKMCLGLLVTAITSFAVLHSETLMSLFFSNQMVFWILAAAELGLVFYLSARIERMSASTASAMFYIYSILNGITLTPIFFAFTGDSIALTFGITAATFGAMCVFGYVTHQDLSRFGSILIMALLGVILCSVVNLFVHSDTMGWIISIAGVLIFVGLTAWDTQMIKRMVAASDPSMMGTVATWGALSLYLDFINLFLYLLRFFGSQRD